MSQQSHLLWVAQLKFEFQITQHNSLLRKDKNPLVLQLVFKCEMSGLCCTEYKNINKCALVP